MGNCIKKESSTQWGGEDWDFAAAGNAAMGEERRVLGEKKGNGFSSSTVTEVKIKITKKQLEELMGKVDVERLTVQQVLTQLMKLGEGYETHHRSWKPALQSIPEADLY